MAPTRLALIAGGVTLLAFGWFLTCGSSEPPDEQTPVAAVRADEGEATARVARQVELVGQVVNGDGDAVPGARVWLLPPPVPLSRCRQWANGCTCADDAATLAQLEAALRPDAEAIADASGRFVFHDVVVRHRASVVATAGGLAGATSDVREGPLVVQVKEAVASLDDAFGAPVAGAVVLSHVGTRVAAVTRFDADGRALLPFDGRGLAVAPGQGGRWLNADDVEPFAPLLGRVVGERPPSLEVAIYDNEDGAACLTGRVDASGGFTLGSLRGGRQPYEVVVSGGGLRGLAMAHPGVPFEVTLRASVTLRGVVRDEDTDEPLPDAVVKVHVRTGGGPNGPEGRLTLTTDAFGRFEAEVMAGEARIGASKAGYAPPRLGFSDEVRRLTPGQRAEVVVLLTPLGVVSGVVEDEAGAPVAGARVMCGEAGVTDSAGRFSLRCPRVHTWVLASAEGYARGSVEVEPPADGLTIRLRSGATVRGRVVDATGEGVSGARVQVKDVGRAPVDTDEDGFFVLDEALEDGRWTLTASTLGSGTRRRLTPLRTLADLTGEAEVEVRASRAPDVTIVVGGAGDVSGRVLDADGAPVADVAVGVRAADDEAHEPAPPGNHALRMLRDIRRMSQVETRSAEDGAFVIEGLASGQHVLFALSADVVDDPAQRVTVRGGERDLILRVVRRPRVRGRVVSADGAPIARFSVGQTGVESPDGRFERPLSDPDSERVTVSAPGYVSEQRTVRASWGETVDLGDVSLARGRSVTVSAVDARTGARVTPLFAVDGRSLSFQEESGRLDGLPLETVSVQVSHFDYQGATLLVPAGLDPAAVLPVKLRRR